MNIPEKEPKFEKKCFIFKITAFESGARNSQNLEQDTFHRQSMCYQTPLRLPKGDIFQVSSLQIVQTLW